LEEEVHLIKATLDSVKKTSQKYEELANKKLKKRVEPNEVVIEINFEPTVNKESYSILN